MAIANSFLEQGVAELLHISRIGHRGDGIAETPTGPVFVPYTLAGESVEVEAFPGHPDRRHLLHVASASPERITPVCPHFAVCGGCQTQHWDFARYREWKRGTVVEALRQAGLDAPVGDLIDAHGEGRRRAVLHARRSAHDVLELGFMGYRAHHIVSIDRCPVLSNALAPAIPAAWALSEALGPLKKPLDIQATATDGGLDVDIRGSGPLRPQHSTALARLAEAHRLARLTRHGELIAQRAAPSVRMGKAAVVLPPGAFLQATHEGEAVLARLVAEHAGNAKAVADLFCGVGPFALRLAERARVVAADTDDGAIAALRQAAKTPGLKPIDAEARDLFRRPFAPDELKSFGAVVFDPPRQGAEAQARQLAASKVPLVVAVSCNAATFARDARLLVDGGYRLIAVTPVDQFRYSAHVEIVARFER
ncbi:MAG: rRNA (uracil1939-C5)-methyltransferase [Hyphomicrobiales bacterium]|jgi:23S rRNA (uracil1939-C5)-methyltransferase|nr:rRNA (uracil1939-C5)-methyltransferase [Hyphomicrobiales bacterium]